MKMSWKTRIRCAAISLAVTMIGYQIELEIVPFRWAAPAFRSPKDSPIPAAGGFHVYFGPFHLWSMSGLANLFGVGLEIGHNPYHGSVLSPRRRA